MMEGKIFNTLLKSSLKCYAEKKVLLIGLMAFFCGIPLLLTASTLSFWLAQEGIKLTTIGLLSLTALPYTLKFVWAPLVDRLSLPILTKYLGRRRAWLFISQMVITLMLVSLSRIHPVYEMSQLAILCFFLALAASIQEIVMLTYQVERLGINQYGAGEAMSIFGYRMGLLVAGAGAFYLATRFSWPQVYGMMACISSGAMLITLMIAEPQLKDNPEATLRETSARRYLESHPHISAKLAKFLGFFYSAVVCPFLDFMQRKEWLISLLIMFLYKTSDNLIGNMSNIFYADLGFSKIEIANASKVFGMWASIMGGFVGGAMIARLGIIKSLFYGGLIHALSLFAHIALYKIGSNLPMLYFTVGIEHFTGGMRLTALFAYQMTLCTSAYAATQLALCSSLITFGRTLFSSISGYMVALLGWPKFFAFAAFLSLPGLFIIVYLAYQKEIPLLKVKKLASHLPG